MQTKRHLQTSNSGNILAYTKPRFYLSGKLEDGGPFYKIFSEFDGDRLYSHSSYGFGRERDDDYRVTYETQNAGSRINLIVSDREKDGKSRIELCDIEAKIWTHYLDTRNWSSEKWGAGNRLCVLCRAPLQLYTPEENNLAQDVLNPMILVEKFLVCQSCGWWLSNSEIKIAKCTPKRFIIHQMHCSCQSFGALRRYPVSSTDVPLSVLQRWLQRHPNDVAHVNPTAFERLIASCFRDVYRDVEVVHVGKVGDQGIDIVMVRNDAVDTLIQVKRRRNIGRAEGVGVVRTLNGVLLRDGVPRGMVVTTAERFSLAAIDEARARSHSLASYSVELLAFNDVVELLNCARTDWRTPEEQIREYTQCLPILREVRAATTAPGTGTIQGGLWSRINSEEPLTRIMHEGALSP